MKLIDKTKQASIYFFPARWHCDCTTSCLGETNPQGLQRSAMTVWLCKNGFCFSKVVALQVWGEVFSWPTLKWKAFHSWVAIRVCSWFVGLSFVLSRMKLRKGMGLFDVISDCPHTSVTSGCKKPWNFLSCQLLLYQPFLVIDANDVKQSPTLASNP